MRTCDDGVNEASCYDKCVDLLSKSDASMRKRGDVVSLRKIEELSLEYLLFTTASPRSGCGTPATLMLLCVASKIARLPPAGVAPLLLPTQRCYFCMKKPLL